MRRGRAAALAALAAVLLAVGRAQVQQDPWAETTDGTGIRINCSHPNLPRTDFIHWYRQLPGRGPEFLVSAHKGSKPLPDPQGQLSVAADRRSSALWLSEPRLRDAAVYYCAQETNPFSAGEWGKLTWGSGTKLLVVPDVTPSPSVYRLTAKDNKNVEMCLITDHSPEKLTLNWADKVTNTLVEVKTSENKQEPSYLSTYWGKKDAMLCGANHEGFGALEGEDPESGSSAFCVTGMSLQFRTNENLNTMSLSQLGLKIILMKGIIFNVLMTMLVWKIKNESNQMVQS